MCLYINPLLDIWFTNIFTHPVGFPFILMMISFDVQKIFIFIKPFLYTFAFVAIAFPVKSKKKALPSQMLRSFPLVFSSRGFMTSGLMFNYLIHFEFCFVLFL